ncbi:MAG: NAD(P)-binding domain-containing protein [Chloroflexi bacterium]|nr:NAD(P)-binding domain-containing protein [Chloroflexota bacterium]
MTIQTVGVIGAGVMGRGLAQALAQTNHQVVLVDVVESALEQAIEDIQKNLRFSAFFQPAAEEIQPAELIARITPTTDYTALQDVDFVIENATERWEVKQPIYQQIDTICRADCIFAVNTSAISITRLAGQTKRPAQVLGMHFMNPVPLKPMVEMIRAFHTSDATIATAKTLLAQMGKDGIVVNDAAGFVTNRVMMLTVNEAIFLLYEQVATASEIDRLFKTCFGHAMGPLETADLIGLDTVLLSLEVLYDSFADSKYRPCPLLKKLVDAGLYGRKSGRGFYTYDD